MPGRKTPLVTDEVYHVFNRGINRQPTFLNKKDFQRALLALNFYRFDSLSVKLSRLLSLEQKKQTEMLKTIEGGEKLVEILAFCLMPNHFHFLVKQKKDNDITKPQPGVLNLDEENLKKEVSTAKKQADIVIVTFHWGTEYKDLPDERQKYLGHLTIDAGADLVIGNHPHWIQPVEIYKNKLITYAHGNFVFDQMWSQKTREGVIGKYIFYNNQLIDVEYFPVQINDYGQPFLINDPSQRKGIIDQMRKNSI